MYFLRTLNQNCKESTGFVCIIKIEKLGTQIQAHVGRLTRICRQLFYLLLFLVLWVTGWRSCGFISVHPADPQINSRSVAFFSNILSRFQRGGLCCPAERPPPSGCTVAMEACASSAVMFRWVVHATTNILFKTTHSLPKEFCITTEWKQF